MDLKSFREDQLKLTQSKFAELIGVEQSLISAWEENPDTIPFTAVEQIMEKTGVSLKELTGWQKPTPKPLDIEDTWEKVNFTKVTLAKYISDSLQKIGIAEEYRKEYVEGLQRIVDANCVKPKVAVVGRSDTGKSTIINVLLETDKMPTSWTPTTSIAVYIKHISDKPSFMKEDVWIFANQVGEENLWNEQKLYDESYCRSWKIGAGDIGVLRSFGTRQGENYKKEAGAAVVFLDSPVLKTCDIVDLPGFGTERESDDNITFATVQQASVVIYLSQANGFMRIEDITYLKRNIKELPVWEKKGANNLKPLSNLFVVASQAHTVNSGNREQLKTILDVGCDSLLKTFPDGYWENKQKLSGYTYGPEELRSRFFAYTVDIPDICSPFNAGLKAILEALSSRIDEETKSLVKSYVELRKPELITEIKKYEELVAEREKYKKLLNEIEKNEFSRIEDNDKRKKEVRQEIDRLSSESIEELSEYIARTINTDALVDLMKERGIKNKKDDIEQFGSYLQSMLQERCEKILEEKSEILSEKVQNYITDYTERIADPFRNNRIAVGFDAGWAFATALSTLGMIGGLGTFLATTVSGVLVFAGAGVSIGTSIWAGMATAPIFGPIGLAVGLAIAAGFFIFNLASGGWRKRTAKKFVSSFDENNFSENFRDGIREYWSQTQDAFDKATAKLEEEWKNYVSDLRRTINEYDIPEIKRKIANLKCLSDFFENIPL